MSTNFNDIVAANAMADEHNLEIISSRVGGFGGSDAKLFLNIAKKGLDKLGVTDLKRIGVAMGLSEPGKQGDNKFTRGGHIFEDQISESFGLLGEELERELKIDSSLAKTFKTFAHADFAKRLEDGTLAIYECKYVQKDMEKVHKEYDPQLNWYYMMDNVSKVTLVHGQGKVEEDGISIASIEQETVEPDEKMIKSLKKGIAILDEAIGNGWKPALEIPDIPEDMANIFATRQIAKRFVEMWTEEKEKAEKEIAAKMQEMGLADGGRLSAFDEAAGEWYTITLSAPEETRRFSRTKLFKAHPELDIPEFYDITPAKEEWKVAIR